MKPGYVGFENEVQYINRMQRVESLDLFRSAGFELTDEETHRIDIGALRLADKYRFMTLNALLSKSRYGTEPPPNTWSSANRSL